MEHYPHYKIGIIGLGYVGLPLARLFIEKGHEVHGIDVDEQKINKLQKRQSYLSDFTNIEIRKLFRKNSFYVGTSFEAIDKVDVIIICVPTPLDENAQPDLKYVLHAAQSSLPYLHRGQLVVLESSTFPGTSEEQLKPILESTGMIVGRDISLAYSPERIDPGSEWELEHIPKIIGGVTPSCTSYAKQVYGSAFDKLVIVSSPRVAEMTKLLENCQRYINISFMNSLLKLCEELDISLWEVIDAAGTKPYGFTKYYPGPGVGGHCIPIDPLYLLWKAREQNLDLPFIELCHQVNKDMPGYIVERVEKGLHPKRLNESSVLVIGVTYKKDVNDIRESTALQIIKNLQRAGVKVSFFDPYMEDLRISDKVIQVTPLTARNIKNFDCTLILTDHSNIPYELVVANSSVVIDTRNATANLKDRSNVIVL
ncbi:UDP-N-acetyl-D-glucosamine dehydrogenase [Paenibacillus baekrokdamisoli]|uniref:UDP-N-acetyl-D-glucosamine dehydrogenase n=1 Tax=Paenibacillus baekrokdamisoli TaxID=1712516 RepID=A0A3G9JLF6_9BACL|nr:nucleotide sugar dehydrogenase [Paenibacillus baekrokdamisoli]MBB3069418.1 UDP-N-acetyl-D-glucosamine dehydrogenase [Paenibacillus baekrokdamisoli]BBH25008.1 UDP-N-acetyl-D-glucosamine dehydrogenase [Paenibacillus baekrokdamisoli]